MTKLTVQRESLGTSTQHSSVSYVNGGDEQVLVSADYALPTSTVFGAHLLEGLLFSIGYTHSFASPLANNASIDIVIAFAPNIQPRIAIEGLCVGNAMGYLYEGATTTGGTALTDVNLNRNSLIASNAAAVLNPTISSTGTMLGSFLIIGGEKKKASGGDMSTASLILKPLTNYLLRLTNVSGAAQAAEMTITWYE
jgi:hypothetical protein